MCCKFFPFLGAETKCGVQCIKHVFANHIVFEFYCTNYVKEQVLLNVSVQCLLPAKFELLKLKPCQRIEYKTTKTAYTVFSMPEKMAWVGTISPRINGGFAYHGPINDQLKDRMEGKLNVKHAYAYCL